MPTFRPSTLPAADFIEASVALLPTDAGGVPLFITPREGNYLPYLQVAGKSDPIHVRFIEGPSSLRSGDSAVVMIEILDEGSILGPGEEVTLLNRQRAVGFGTILRVWRRR